MTDFDVDSLYGRRAVQRWNRMVVGDIFERVTWSRPDKEALIGWEGAYATDDYRRVTYRQADERANQVANALLAAGLQRGERVVLLCDNSVEALLAMVGIAKAGLVCAPLNSLMAPDVSGALMQRIQASYAIVDGDLWPRAEAAFAKVGLAPGVTIPIGGPPAPGSVTFADWIRDQPTTEPEVEVHADDVWQLLFTSGTTSLPKASMGTHTYSYTAAYTWALTTTRGLRFEDELRICTFLPIIYHCGHHATLLPAVFAGGTLIVGRRPDPVATARAVTEERPSALWAGSPQYLEGLATAAETDGTVDLTSLSLAFFSWAAIAPAVADRFVSACDGVELLEVFGQTEAMSCYRSYPLRDEPRWRAEAPAVNRVGAPNPMLAATIMDSDGNLLTGQVGVPGEAVFRGPTVTVGYYGDEAATQEAFAGGWFHSGDSCVYDDDGSQVMVDRYKDIVKTGGEVVSSQRVESIAALHPAVARVAVIGLPDDRWGEAITAVVTLRADTTLAPEELIRFCRARLAGFETPKRVVLVDSMPETVGGKILKYKLREQLA